MRQKVELQELTRAAVLLAVACAVQCLRLVLPFTWLVTMFAIGTVVNMCLVLTAQLSDVRLGLLSSLLLPLLAFLQGQLPLLPMVAVVFAGNLVLVLIAARLKSWRLLVTGPLLKTLTLWAGTGVVIGLVGIHGDSALALQWMMSWPQLITSLLGIILASLIRTRLK